jgi:hypothetical protein
MAHLSVPANANRPPRFQGLDLCHALDRLRREYLQQDDAGGPRPHPLAGNIPGGSAPCDDLHPAPEAGAGARSFPAQTHTDPARDRGPDHKEARQ